MCGIFGWAPSAAYARADIPVTAQKLQQALAHRGPDGRDWAAFGSSGALLATERDSSGLSGQAWALLLGQTRTGARRISLPPNACKLRRSIWIRIAARMATCKEPLSALKARTPATTGFLPGELPG